MKAQYHARPIACKSVCRAISSKHFTGILNIFEKASDYVASVASSRSLCEYVPSGA